MRSVLNFNFLLFIGFITFYKTSFTGSLQLSDQGTDGGASLYSDTCCSYTKLELSSTADAAKAKPILDRPGYTLTITKQQRKYSCPLLNWNEPPPPNGSQVIISFTILLNCILINLFATDSNVETFGHLIEILKHNLYVLFEGVLRAHSSRHERERIVSLI